MNSYTKKKKKIMFTNGNNRQCYISILWLPMRLSMKQFFLLSKFLPFIIDNNFR